MQEKMSNNKANTGLTPSMEDVNASVDTTQSKSVWKRLLSFLGPAYLVSVGYMDPGNWATDIAGGSAFGYTLLWVLLMSNLMALVLQSLAARLGIVSGLDLAQASRMSYPKVVNFFLWLLAEIAIAATDLAEVIGMAIGLKLLFGVPLLYGVLITLFDTFLLLFLQRFGMRKMEAFIIGLVAIIGLSFLVEMFFAQPNPVEMAKGLIPSIPNETALYLAIGIIGATVMPHNLYLHSALVQTRKFRRSDQGIWEAIKFNFIDSAIALNLAFFVNSAILVLAASTFYKAGMTTISDIEDAHQLLQPLLGTEWAPILFATALLCAGQSSTLTGTLSGQIVMEGYLNLRMQPWLRRLITRLVAIVPAVATIVLVGEGSVGKLLVFSQVLLSLQLGFAIVPLIHFTSSKLKMGKFAISKPLAVVAWIIALVIVGLNMRLVVDQIETWIAESTSPALIYVTAVPAALLAFGLLIYIAVKPLLKSYKPKSYGSPHGALKQIDLSHPEQYGRIAITIDFSDKDVLAIKEALRQGGKSAEYRLIHIVETAGARMYGDHIHDKETQTDTSYIQEYIAELSVSGYKASYVLGYGSPKERIPVLVSEFKADLLVMGVHGHRMLKDILLGTTLDAVRHAVSIPIFIVK
jgi:manganese transport protein